MPIPENPQSRSEQYLNAIATGDKSGLPEFPQSRMEQYLDVIAQNGGGGGGVLVVHADENRVLDKTWQEIKDASATKPVVILPEPGSQFSPQLWVLNVFNGDEMYGVLSWGTFNFNEPNMLIFVVSSADGYPVYTPT